MSCSNCFNGCTEIVSDQCVKYTGIDVPVLGIQTGDSLSYVEQALITFLTSTLDGTGIIPNINTGSAGISCNLVSQYLPVCGDITIVDLVSALIQASCDLQGQVDVVVAELATLNDDYTIDCLTGVSASSDTHIVLQAVIDNFCSLSGDVSILALNLATNYASKGTELDTYIEDYLINNPTTTTLMKDRMVPYAAIPYFGALGGYFSNTGVGSGIWDRVFLCNGDNNTPDLRGRVPVGGTNTYGILPMDSAVDPGSSVFNPLYNPTFGTWTKTGSNSTILITNQLPVHNHGTTATPVIIPDHSHFTTLSAGSSTPISAITPIRAATVDGITPGVANIGLTSASGAITFTPSVITTNTGSNLPHSNTQPGIACYYIMYIP